LTVHQPHPVPRIGWELALARGRDLMAQHAARRPFTIDEEVSLSRVGRFDAYVYTVRSSLDIRERGGETRVYLSASDGRELAFLHPRLARGNAVRSWLSALHLRAVWGRPYQLFVSLVGIVVALLAVTGVLVWYRRTAALRGTA
jgi:uncharacterized iron-regulated membrane protein